jgi:hypothetical protein
MFFCAIAGSRSSPDADSPDRAVPTATIPLAGRTPLWGVCILFFAIRLPLVGYVVYWVAWFLKGLGQLH